MDSSQPLSPLASRLITELEKEEPSDRDRKIVVSPVVSKFAAWYEKFRTAMDYREEAVILRAAIERILKRRLLLGGNGKTVAEPLVRELVWARYFPNNSVSEAAVERVEKVIDLFIQLRQQVLFQHKFSETEVNEWVYQLMSATIERTINSNREKEIVANFMFHVLRENVTVVDDKEETKDAQVYLAIRRSFAKDDIAFLRYYLFKQFFGDLNSENFQKAAQSFPVVHQEIQRQLNYPSKDRITSYIRNKTPIFLILEELFRLHKGKIRQLSFDEKELQKIVFEICGARYNEIASKVRRAIVRSVIFILFTKSLFALFIEGTYERIFYGRIFWSSLAINTAIPPLLMIVVGLFIRPPTQENSERIFSHIRSIFYDPRPDLGGTLVVKKTKDKQRPFLNTVFTILWFLAFIISFGFLIFILSKLQFTLINQAVFIFFLTIVSFLSYRIGLVPKTYIIEERQGLLTPLVDFFFMPVIRVGRHLTEGIAQINIFLFLFDFIIETPFKGIFAFFEQWFFFLHAKREEMG